MSQSVQVTLEDAYKLAEKYQENGDLYTAENIYRDILKDLPEDFNALNRISIVCYHQGKLEEGIEYAKKAIEQDPENNFIWNTYGIMLGDLGRHEEALEAFEKSKSLDPEFGEVYSNICYALINLKRFEEAEEVGKNSIKLQPNNPNFHVNLGVSYIKNGKLQDAIDAWIKALDIEPNHAKATINLGSAYREIGEIKKAEEFCLKALELAPQSPEANLNYGNICRDKKDFESSEKYLRQAISIKPDYIDAHNNLALLMVSVGNYAEAASSSRFALAFDANNIMALQNLGQILLETGELEEASIHIRKALRLDSESVDTKLTLVNILYLQDKLSEAENLLNETIEDIPDNPFLYVKLASTLEKALRFDEALEAAEKALEISPDLPEVYYRISMIHFMNNATEKALEAIDTLIKISPEYAPAYSTKSEILQAIGDMEDAETAISKAIELSPDTPAFYGVKSKLKKFTEGDEDLKKMEEIKERFKDGAFGQKVGLYFGLFKAYEDIKDYPKAFSYLKEGNDLKSKSVFYAHEAGVKTINIIKQRYTPELWKDVEDKGYESNAPIFIVGMPRSGTTLTEQIISSHPDVFGAGELHFLNSVEREIGIVSQDNCADLGRKYEDLVYENFSDAKSTKHFTDKMPGNFTNVGLIAAALPNAKIIHCRRNPIDTCLSCYKQLFARGQYWSYNMHDLVDHYKFYVDMMDFWRDTIPDRFTEIFYEDTVGDLETQARKLIDYVGLEWNEACLTPHKTKRSVLTASKQQVRKPVYKTSVEAWRRYEKEFEYVAKELEPYVVKRA
ncbi:MAG: tetratricopeptide repeat protein [Pseudomonadota bacterium]